MKNLFNFLDQDQPNDERRKSNAIAAGNVIGEVLDEIRRRAEAVSPGAVKEEGARARAQREKRERQQRK
jgi:hypothetical protein